MSFLAAAALVASIVQLDSWSTTTLFGGFSIEAPVKLSVIYNSASGPKSRGYEGMHKEVTFLAVVSEVEPQMMEEPLDRRLAISAASYLSEFDAEITSQRDLVYRGWHGIEINVKGPGFVGKYRGFAVNGRVFEAACEWEAGRKAPPEADRFLLSMAIPVGAGAGPAKAAGPTFTEFKLEGTEITVMLPEKPRLEKRSDPPVSTVSFYSGFSNRMYMCTYVDIPEEAAALMPPVEEIHQMFAEKFTLGLGGSITSEKTYKLNDKEVLSVVGEVRKRAAFRLDVFVHGLRIYALIAIVPKPLKNSDEVAGFFKSLKLG